MDWGIPNGLWMQPLLVDVMEKVVEESDDQHPLVVVMMEFSQLRYVGYQNLGKFNDIDGKIIGETRVVVNDKNKIEWKTRKMKKPTYTFILI